MQTCTAHCHSIRPEWSRCPLRYYVEGVVCVITKHFLFVKMRSGLACWQVYAHGTSDDPPLILWDSMPPGSGDCGSASGMVYIPRSDWTVSNRQSFRWNLKRLMELESRHQQCDLDVVNEHRRHRHHESAHYQPTTCTREDHPLDPHSQNNTTVRCWKIRMRWVRDFIF